MQHTGTIRDATLVRKLKLAGAVVVGKACIPDFADYMSDHMPSGYCGAVNGFVRHPVPGEAYGRGGGSSVGVACAVAIGLAPVGIGSETQNSIQAPCCNSGVVGIKPTVGLVSRAGMVPLAISQDTAGPIARTVRDACAVLSVIAGPDIEDLATLTGAGPIDYTAFCEVAGFPRIGVVRGFAMWEEKTAYAEHCLVVENALRNLELAGAELVNAEIATADEVSDLKSSVFRTEFKAGLNAFLGTWAEPSAVKSMAEVVAFNTANPEAIPYGMTLLEASNATRGDLSEVAYREDRARDLRMCRGEGIDACLAKFGVDVLVAPMDRAAKMLGKAGYPAVSIPCGHTPGGVPVGITFFGTAFSEPMLIQAAANAERVFSQA
jgi:amidase